MLLFGKRACLSRHQHLLVNAIDGTLRCMLLRFARAFTCLFVPFSVLLRAADNWPQFRGPGARGVSENANRPDQWNTTNNVEWKVAVPGRGWSSPIVWGDKVFLTTVVSEGDME